MASSPRSSRRPQRALTTYYLMLSSGVLWADYRLAGSCLTSSAVAPRCSPLSAVCGQTLLHLTRSPGDGARGTVIAVIGTTAWAPYQKVEEQVSHSRVMLRNFYSEICTNVMAESSCTVPLTVHGGIMHGGQLLDPDLQPQASSYPCPDSGFGRLFDALADEPRRVGVIGLGATTTGPCAGGGCLPLLRDQSASRRPRLQGVHLPYGNPGEDRRGSRRRPTQSRTRSTGGVDVIAMDAFPGDAIPMHPITRKPSASI